MLYAMGSVLIILTMLLSLGFTVAYHVYTRGAWRNTEAGRYLMSATASIGLVTLVWSIAVVARLLGTEVPHWFDLLRLVVFIAVPATLTWLWTMLVRVHR